MPLRVLSARLTDAAVVDAATVGDIVSLHTVGYVYVVHDRVYDIHSYCFVNGQFKKRSEMAGRREPKSRKGGASKSAPRGKSDLATVAANAAFESEEIRKRSESLWEAQQRPGRGPKPALTREDVVVAAISVADAGDLAALTMHAVAAKLGYTPMALYRYFPNKEALIDAAVDAALGDPPKRSGPREGWRAEVKHWAYAKRTMLCARPWLAELPFVAAPHGPNWLSWHEAFLRTIADTGLSRGDMMDVLSMVHGYVSGCSDPAISLARATSRGIAFEDWARAVRDDLSRAINNPRYPLLSGILSAGPTGIAAASSSPAKSGHPRTLDESFDFGLERVLDGIQTYLTPLDETVLRLPQKPSITSARGRRDRAR